MARRPKKLWFSKRLETTYSEEKNFKKIASEAKRQKRKAEKAEKRPDIVAARKAYVKQFVDEMIKVFEKLTPVAVKKSENITAKEKKSTKNKIGK